ncbi:MmgE/PrpD family protein [Pseudonocardia sp. C8]|uniref:MmgE/PrpD family protein n=1 Tax=Pseudonocardia sp. C8 TaxID=2762759 RepID=UPI001642C386|nr:MmgE/PrpD family protein [Pseudonocardia sp. C8]MBC3191716.1 MmgE/PrpD family protein [Pseudonocardia sp. C8]
MPEPLVDQLAGFATAADTAALPAAVVSESKRILLDSLGCAVASHGERGADIAVRYAQVLGGHADEASIIGTDLRTTQLGAAFANAELINALDQDAVLPPGHVTPYVLPGALAAAEAGGVPGARLLAAIAVSHEISYRIGKATDYLRDMKDGVVTIPPVIGYSSTIFGAAAAIGVTRGYERETVADALGIAGSTVPVNAQRAWMMHAPATTIKYQLAGGMAWTALTAASLAEFGHRGDRRILDDAEYGFPRFIGTKRWVPEPITDGLGSDWRFTAEQAFKPYPHCRVMHGIFDALTEIVDTHDLKPDEIESITAYGESFVQQPTWVNTDVTEARDAEFSMTHGLAVAAHRVPPGKDWLAPELVRSESVLALMNRSRFEPHPDFTDALSGHVSARPSRVEVTAHGETHVGERNFPKGVSSPDPSTYMTDDELAAKFRHNVAGVLSDADAEAVVAAVTDLENVDDVRVIMERLRPA